MTESDLRKFAHDIRGPVHSAKLNLEVARSLVARGAEVDFKRLEKCLQIIQEELNKLERNVTAFGKKLDS